MKQDVFDILLYLFENYIYDDGAVEQDKEQLNQELVEAGFSQREIHKAFDWLEGLAEMHVLTPSNQPVNAGAAMRIYAKEEMERLDTECRGFLLFLEQMGVLDAQTREMVIDRVMALDSDEIDLEQVKWVILMVLFNQPGQEAAVAWMEDMVLDEVPAQHH